MRKNWWTVWIEVAVMAVILFFAYTFLTNTVEKFLSPYLIEEHEVGVRNDNMIKDIVEVVEEKLDVRIDYENMIFDYANGYAMDMMDQSEEERQFLAETYSIVEEYGDATETDEDDSQED